MHLLLNLMATVGANEVYYQPEFTTMTVNSYGHIQVVHSRVHLLLNLMATVVASEVDYQPEFTTMVINS